MKPLKQRIFGLDVVRALAILMVLVSHCNYFFEDYDNLFIDSLQLMGVLGVEIFFVLSGFLIGGMLLQMVQSLRMSFNDVLYFWVRRWFRTLPLYFLMLLANIGVALIVGDNLPSLIWKYVFFLQNFSNDYLPFFPESWSLSVEEYAYLLAPLVLWGSFKMFKNKNINRDNLFLVVSACLVLTFVCAKIFYHVSHIGEPQSLKIWNSNLKALVVYRLDAIFYGFILVYCFNKYHDKIKQNKRKLFLLGIVMCLVVAGLLPLLGITIEAYPVYWNVFYLPIISITIGLTIPYLYFFKVENAYTKRIVTNISLYSYSMYLLHYTFLLYLMRLLINFQDLTLWYRFICVLAYLLLTYVLSRFVYLYFEKPMTNLRDAKQLKNILVKHVVN
ncbi:acyltransferase family protein [Snuella sedimenti]|uniref:Acyltransferase n=1 Tax=Snuella sedimenti TaxID=2798802 RepID=A0A8J7J3Q7_9FLAO|nr:acyltransferase [Snuella sedimenti]MBJ6368339.1 acyltransferase [Snuella sedimenti]